MELKFFPALFDRPTNIRFSDQESDEHIELLLRRHFVTNIHWLVLSFLGLLAPLFIVDINHNLQVFLVSSVPFEIRLAYFIIWYLFILGYIIESFLYWYFNIYIVTNKRLVDFDFSSVLNKSIKESRLDDVQAITTQLQGIIRPLLNFGNVVMETAAKDETIEFVDVPQPELVAQRIEELQNTAEAVPVAK